MMHIHAHAKAQVQYADQEQSTKQNNRGMSKQALLNLIESLRSTIKKLEWEPAGTEWGNYYDITNYTDDAFEHKKELITEWLAEQQPSQVWDLGANNGVFSRLASDKGFFTVSFDIDPAAVEQNYKQVKEKKEVIKSNNTLILVTIFLFLTCKMIKPVVASNIITIKTNNIYLSLSPSVETSGTTTSSTTSTDPEIILFS